MSSDFPWQFMKGCIKPIYQALGTIRVKSMREDRIHKMREWNAEGRMRPKKPQEKFMDGIRTTMNRLELTEHDAQDRNLWKNKFTLK